MDSDQSRMRAYDIAHPPMPVTCCVHTYEAAQLGQGDPPLPFRPFTHLSEGEPFLGCLFQQPGQQRLQRLRKGKRCGGGCLCVVSAGKGVHPPLLSQQMLLHYLQGKAASLIVEDRE